MQQTTAPCPEQQRRETIQDLANQARQQTVDAYGPQAADLFHHAEQLVNAGRVQLTARNCGLVYVEPAGWKNVYPGYCAHCRLTDPTLVCVHKLAVAYADLLHRHLVLNGEHPPAPARRFDFSRSSTTPPGTSGHYAARPHWTRRRAGTGDHQHCPRCGGWLTAEGACNRCGGAR